MRVFRGFLKWYNDTFEYVGLVLAVLILFISVVALAWVGIDYYLTGSVNYIATGIFVPTILFCWVLFFGD